MNGGNRPALIVWIARGLTGAASTSQKSVIRITFPWFVRALDSAKYKSLVQAPALPADDIGA